MSEAELRKFFTEVMENHTQRPFNVAMAVAYKKAGFTDPQTYYDLVNLAVAHGIIRKAIHPETKATWIVMSDDDALPF